MRGLFTHRVALGLDTPLRGRHGPRRGRTRSRRSCGPDSVARQGNRVRIWKTATRNRTGFGPASPTDDDIRAVAAAFPARRRDSLSADHGVPDGPADPVAPPIRSDNGRRGNGAKTLIPASLLAALTDAVENER